MTSPKAMIQDSVFLKFLFFVKGSRQREREREKRRKRKRKKKRENNFSLSLSRIILPTFRIFCVSTPTTRHKIRKRVICQNIFLVGVNDPVEIKENTCQFQYTLSIIDTS